MTTVQQKKQSILTTPYRKEHSILWNITKGFGLPLTLLGSLNQGDAIGGHVACTEEMRNTNITAGQCEEKRPFVRSRNTWKKYIKMGLRETGCEDWFN